MRLLVVDDTSEIGELFKEILVEAGYAVDTAYTAMEAEILARSIHYDLILLDVVLPGRDGFEQLKDLRRQRIYTAAVMISGQMKDDQYIIRGINAGAVEYLTKPINPKVLVARITALLRKEHNIGDSEIQIGNLLTDTVHHQVWQEEREIFLTKKEYSIFEYLLYHPDKVVSRTELEEHVWDFNLDSSSNIVDQHIKNLRTKLGEDNESLIETVRGLGYRLRMH